MTKIYLACPYTHEDAKIREYRFGMANVQAGYLMKVGYVVFSPITHGHAIEKDYDRLKGKDWRFWQTQCFPFLEWADEVHVMKLNGWKESVGVQAEIKRAEELGKIIKYIEV